MMPACFVVIAGPNGAGKSTFVGRKKFDFPVIDPDAIARKLKTRGTVRLLQAGRGAHSEIDALFLKREPFGLETTLSGMTVLASMRRARDIGMLVHLHYIGLASLELSKLRVVQRVALGGHGIEANDLERRYERSLTNLFAALKIADEAWIYDNSSQSEFHLVAKNVHGAWIEFDRGIAWLQGARERAEQR